MSIYWGIRRKKLAFVLSTLTAFMTLADEQIFLINLFMKQYIRMIACLLWLCAMGVGLAQTQSISGVVTDEQGVPLPGTTILEQGTTNGVTTDFDGNFAIDVSQGANLEISFVGHTTQTLPVGAETYYAIHLIITVTLSTSCGPFM